MRTFRHNRNSAREAGKVRGIFGLSFVANLILALVSLAILPDRVAIHFGLGGTADGWASNLMNTLMMLGMHTLVFCSLYFAPRLLTTMLRRWISLPNRDYWRAPERRTQAAEHFAHRIWQFGTAVFLFLLVAGLLTLRANLSDPVRLDERAFLVALALVLLYTVAWTVALLRAFRVPAGTAR